MKRISLFTFFVVFIYLAYGQPFSYTIEKKNESYKSVHFLYISYEMNGKKIVDTISLHNKKIRITKSIVQPTEAILSCDNEKFPSIRVFLANNSMSVAEDNNQLVISKNMLQLDFEKLIANDAVRVTYYPLYGALNAKKDTVGLKKLAVIFDSLRLVDRAIAYDYLKKCPTSFLSLLAFTKYAEFFADPSVLKKDYDGLPAWAKKTTEGINWQNRIKAASGIRVNGKAPDFAQFSYNNKTVKLSDFKGKYILLDFWASWCAPCRREHPRLIEIYNQYKDKNFVIISISLDNDKEAWMNAIKKDKLNWTNLSDLRGAGNEVAVLYAVQIIPANFLIDPKGIIIAKSLTTDQIVEQLKLYCK